MKKSLIIIVVIAAIGLLAWSQRVTILTRVMEKGLEARMGADIVDSFEDGLHLALCGAGGPMPAIAMPITAIPSRPSAGPAWWPGPSPRLNPVSWSPLSATPS
jgi:hypothetical protein